jgi:hypothetical protein
MAVLKLFLVLPFCRKIITRKKSSTHQLHQNQCNAVMHIWYFNGSNGMGQSCFWGFSMWGIRICRRIWMKLDVEKKVGTHFPQYGTYIVGSVVGWVKYQTSQIPIPIYLILFNLSTGYLSTFGLQSLCTSEKLFRRLKTT